MSQFKSKRRIAEHGEVFTNKREVNAMLDLVKQETERIESRFLEPTCGNGNFLAEILKRKLAVVTARYKRNQFEFERYAVIAISSIYGIDILLDNVEESRSRLYNIFKDKYGSLFGNNTKAECFETVLFILSRNILHGNALTMNMVETNEPIIFSEWSPVNGRLIKRRDYEMASLLKAETAKANHASSANNHESNLDFLPKPIAVFPVTHFLKLYQHDEKLQSRRAVMLS